MNKMSNKNLEEMKGRLEKEFDVLIGEGMNEGFYFKGENAKHMQELQDTIIYIFQEQEREIDALNDAISHMSHIRQLQRNRILELKADSGWVLEKDKLPEKKGHYLVTSAINYYHGGNLDKNKDGTTKSMAVAYYDGTDQVGGKHYWNHAHVIAWRPLPEAY